MEMLSLNLAYPDGPRMSFQKTASAVLHVFFLAALAYQARGVAKIRKLPPRTAVVLVPYAPGHQAVVQPPKPKIVPTKEEPKLAMKEPEPPPPSTGGDPSGEADVSVAMADFYPEPRPDLSTLPHGTRGDVVIDIVIDEEGKVVDTHVDQGLGHGVDEAVMAVIQTWTFTPATKAGKPVASKQQLLFHFEHV
jgi:periplasmic protein TonB